MVRIQLHLGLKLKKKRHNMGTELHFEVGHALKHMTTTQLDLYATGPNSTLPVSNNLFCINDVIRVTESRNLGFAS